MCIGQIPSSENANVDWLTPNFCSVSKKIAPGHDVLAGSWHLCCQRTERVWVRAAVEAGAFTGAFTGGDRGHGGWDWQSWWNTWISSGPRVILVFRAKTKTCLAMDWGERAAGNSIGLAALRRNGASRSTWRIRIKLAKLCRFEVPINVKWRTEVRKAQLLTPEDYPNKNSTRS